MSTKDYTKSLATSQRLIEKFGGLWTIGGRKRSNQAAIANPWEDEGASETEVTGVNGVALAYDARQLNSNIISGDKRLLLSPDNGTVAVSDALVGIDYVIEELTGKRWGIVAYSELKPDDVVILYDIQVRA